jgi:MFS family permease
MDENKEKRKVFLGGWKNLKEIIPNNKEVFKQIFTSLHSRNYKLYFYGQIISLVGSFIQQIAMSWLVYRITGSVLMLATVTFVSQIPSFFISPVSGVIADRFEKRKLLILTQSLFMLQAFIMAALVLGNLIEPWHIIALSLFLGFIQAMDMPARQAITIELVDRKEDIGNAIALNSAMFNSARLIGPSIGGFLIAIFGEGLCFLINGLSYIAVLFSLYKIISKPVEKSIEKKNIRQDINEGFKYATRSVPIRSALIMLGIVSFFGFSLLVFLPPFAKDILKGNSNTLGFMMSAFGAGALVAALYLAARKSVVGLGKIIMLSVLIMGISLIALFFVHVSRVAYIIGFPLGFTLIASVASLNTQLQTLSDEKFRGRVMSLYAMSLMGVTPIGALILGYLEKFIGIQGLFLINGIVLILIALVYEYYWPVIRKHMRKIYVEKGILPEIAIGIQSVNKE